MICHAGSPSCESTQDFDLELARFGQWTGWRMVTAFFPINSVRVRQIKCSSNLGTVTCERSNHLSWREPFWGSWAIWWPRKWVWLNVTFSGLQMGYLPRDPGWNWISNLALDRLCGQMMINRWDKMCEEIMKCSPSANAHPVLMAEEAKIEYGPCELWVEYYLEFIFKGREVVSERIVIYLKENSYLPWAEGSPAFMNRVPGLPRALTDS